MTAPRNPAWTSDELVLALDLYLHGGRVQLLKGDPRVVELSSLLQRLTVHPPAARVEGFRNVNSVAMKVANFASIDPEYEKAGLSTGGKLDQVVWDRFAADPGRLTALSAAIRASVDGASVAGAPDQMDSEPLVDEEFFEGRLLARLHVWRERRPDKVAKRKRAVLEREGALRCEACGFDFEEVYGPIGAGFAECHHRTPLASLTPGQSVRMSDLAVLCANCHRAIHRSGRQGPMLTVEQLRDLLVRRARDGKPL